MREKATLRYLRIAPRKVRLVAELIRGKKASEARAILRFCGKRAAAPLQKTLQSALASAAHNSQAAESNLYIAKVEVQEGPKLKRYRARARGRAYPIQKKTSHITLVLDEIVPATDLSPSNKPAPSSPEAGKESNFAGKPKFRPLRKSPEREQAPKRNMGVKRFFRRKTI